MRNDASCDNLGTGSMWNNGRKLPEVTDDDDNFATKRFVVSHEIAQQSINRRDDVVMEHAHFIDKEAIRSGQEHALVRSIGEG